MSEMKKIYSYARKYRKKMYTAVILLVCSVGLGIASYYSIRHIMMRFLMRRGGVYGSLWGKRMAARGWKISADSAG